MPSPVSLQIDVERWPLRAPFRIAGRDMTEQKVVVATLHHDGLTGRGEAAGIFFQQETAAIIAEQLNDLRPAFDTIEGCRDILAAMPTGGARNALDCALWELTARIADVPVWSLAGLPEPRPLVTHYTIGADRPTAMAAQARALPVAHAIKLKLIGDGHDAERVRAVRAARPDVTLSVDGNQGLDIAGLRALLPTCHDAAVALIEQPLPIGAERDLADVPRDIPLAADESARTRADLDRLRPYFDIVNIKLDKSGGLTEAIAMARQARALGFGLMVGNMIGTSLAMAPAYLVAQLCDHVDLDGPTLLAADRADAVRYAADGTISCDGTVWG